MSWGLVSVAHWPPLPLVSRPPLVPPPSLPPADRFPGDGRRHAVPRQHHLALGPARLQQAPCQHQVRDHHILRPDPHSCPSATPHTYFLSPCIQLSINSLSHTQTHAPHTQSLIYMRVRAFSLWWYSVPQGCLLLHPPLPCPATHTNLLPAMTNTPAALPCLPNTPGSIPRLLLLQPMVEFWNGSSWTDLILQWPCSLNQTASSSSSSSSCQLASACKSLVAPRGCIFIILSFSGHF